MSNSLTFTETALFFSFQGTLLSGDTSYNRCSKGRRWRDGTFCFHAKSNIDTGMLERYSVFLNLSCIFADKSGNTIHLRKKLLGMLMYDQTANCMCNGSGMLLHRLVVF